MIYFARMGDSGPVKIGYTTSLEHRLRTFSGVARQPIRAIATRPGTRGDERYLHYQFSPYQTRGPTSGIEWFLPSHELAEMIAGLGGELRGPLVEPRKRPEPHSDGESAFRIYIRDIGLTPGGAARSLGCCEATIAYILGGKTSPGEALAAHIEEWSSGKVKATCWLERDGVRFREARRWETSGNRKGPGLVARRAEALRLNRTIPLAVKGEDTDDVLALESALCTTERELKDARFGVRKLEQREEALRQKLRELATICGVS